MNVHEAIENRRSVREYQDCPIPDEVMQKLLNALRYAPSACNFQPWRFVLITEPQQRRQIAQACSHQTWIAQAPLIVAGCGLPDQAYKTIAGSVNAAHIDVTIAMDHLSLAAVAEGIGSCWIGAFEETAVKDILSVPKDATVVVLMTLGYPKSPELIHPVEDSRRRSPDEIFRSGSYQ